MDFLVYSGITVRRSELAAIISTVARGGRLPGTHIGDPVGWLVGLVQAARGTELEGHVHRALHTILRTGSAGALEVVARVATQEPLFDVPTLSEALERAHTDKRSSASVPLALAIRHAVLAEPDAYDPRLRALWGAAHLRRALLPAVLVGDLEWALLQLQADCAGDRSDRLREELQAVELPDPLREEVHQRLWPAAPAPAEPAPPDAPEPDAPTPEDDAPFTPELLSVAQLPWRGADGAWYRIPEGRPLQPGRYMIRRGLQTLSVSRMALDGLEIDPETARQARTRQLEALLDLVGGPAATHEPARQRLARTRGQLAGVLGSPTGLSVLEGLARALRHGLQGGPADDSEG